MATTKRGPARTRKTSSTAARRPAPKRKVSTFERTRKSLATHLGRQSDDVWGLLLVALGVVSALGIYADLTGPVGRFLRDVAGLLFGWGRLALPVAIAGVGFALLQGRPRQEPARVVIGTTFMVLSGTGLIHLANGTPSWTDPAEELRAAGGLVGVAMAEPLRGLLAVPGAALILSALGIVGLLVLLRLSARDAWGHLVRGMKKVIDVLSGSARHLAAATTPDVEERVDATRRHPATQSPPMLEVVPPLAEDDEPAPEPEPEPEITVSVPETTAPVSADQLAIDLGPAHREGAWRLPALALLKRSKAVEIDRRMIEAGGRTLEHALAAHGVETRLVGMTVGPTVTRYELELGPGVKVAKVTSLNKDIAYAMASPDVRILAPIPGKSAIGVEVPNRDRQLVALADILATEEARQAKHPLEVALGKDIAGRAVMANLAEMPHILIAGATGAGKSSCINSLITSVLVRSTPDQVRMILIDPKRVELGQYNGLPHLLTQVVVNPKRAANALSWAVKEMERRYELLYEVGVRDITGYNAAFDRGDLKPEPGEDKEYRRLPFILVVVDELADLMMVAARDVEDSICRIAQMARAVGIHLVIATQRPSVDVITGVIKANVPSRLAFAVSSQTDSRVILDQPGAERLVGKGDMLLLTANSSSGRRVQGAWVGEDEVRKVAAHWKRQARPDYVEGVEGDDSGPGDRSFASSSGSDSDDELLRAARDLVVRSQLGSTSMLQRKLKVGFARAGRLMDLLEESGVVGPSEGSKARAVLMTVEELEALDQAS
ncbi:MAG: segregation ATPase FtsK/SpoIIIE, family [Actinomycetota bacterium]